MTDVAGQEEESRGNKGRHSRDSSKNERNVHPDPEQPGREADHSPSLKPPIHDAASQAHSKLGPEGN